MDRRGWGKREGDVAARAEAVKLVPGAVPLTFTPTSFVDRYAIPDHIELVSHIGELPSVQTQGNDPRVDLDANEEEFAFVVAERARMRAYARAVLTAADRHAGEEAAEDGPWLKWSVGRNGAVRQSSPVDKALFEFITLAGASDTDILAFARRWGPLGICYCGEVAKPSTSCLPRGMTWNSNLGWFGSPSGFCWEPVSAWRHLAEQARGVVNLSIALTDKPQQERLAETDLRAIHDPRRDGSWEELRNLARLRRDLISIKVALIVQRWLRRSDLAIDFRWGDSHGVSGWHAGAAFDTDGPGAGYAHYSLFGLVAFRIAALLGSGQGVYRCDNPTCGRAYSPDLGRRERRPKAGQHKFCPPCREDNRASKSLSARKRRMGTRVAAHAEPL